LFTFFIAFEMAPKRVQLSLSEKNAIAALHKAGLKGQAIAREMGHPLPNNIWCFKTFYTTWSCGKQ